MVFREHFSVQLWSHSCEEFGHYSAAETHLSFSFPEVLLVCSWPYLFIFRRGRPRCNLFLSPCILLLGQKHTRRTLHQSVGVLVLMRSLQYHHRHYGSQHSFVSIPKLAVTQAPEILLNASIRLGRVVSQMAHPYVSRLLIQSLIVVASLPFYGSTQFMW